MADVTDEARAWTERATDLLELIADQRCALSAFEIEDRLVCDRRGSLESFTDEGLQRAADAVARRVPLAVSEHEAVLHGTCRAYAS